MQFSMEHDQMRLKVDMSCSFPPPPPAPPKKNKNVFFNYVVTEED